ncbi:MAG: N-acetyl-gamma-glutamyl-phosphate reductase [Thermoplasmata archaeon]|nr:N-acetyl-gamma-glutamyl-phosphate reductase [Thermoplasmata archaeon]
MATAAVLGATGYLGSELLRIVSEHPNLSLVAAVSKSQAGRKLSEVAPQISVPSDLVLTSDASAVDADVAFLAQPAGEAMQVVPALLERGIKVVDLGPDYRLKDPLQYERAYGSPHADPEHLGEAVYGLPELFRSEVKRARLIANPGCYPTATILALAPLLKHQEIHGPIVVDAKSGTSGAGSGLTSSSHHPEAALTVLPYGTPFHRHVPEMSQVLGGLNGGAPSLVFVPHLVPLVRGILCSIYATPSEGAHVDRWESLLKEAYSPNGFVRVGGVPKLPWASGTNRCYLSVQSAGTAPVLFSVLDNLGKGGAGQAVQNANLMFGWDETLGLRRSGFGV